MAMKHNKHIFAFYTQEIDTSDVSSDTVISLYDTQVLKRMTKVVRLRAGEVCILFGKKRGMRAELVDYNKKSAHVRVTKTWNVNPVTPYLYWFVPVAERGVFETALSHLTVLGIHTIYPVITEKSKRKWGTEKDFDRAHRVMVAAAEQSKQFAIPAITQPYTIENMPQIATYRFIGDPTGSPISAYTSYFSQVSNETSFAGIIGPEGGFTNEELAYLDTLGYDRLRLIPHILRTEDAVFLGAGLIRSLLTD